MEPADIDWRNLEWRFVRDDLYEHFNAPKWVDLSAPSPRGGSPSTVPADEAWFCRSDCRHPKTAEDFHRLGSTPPSGQPKVKLARARSSPLGERNPSNSSNNSNAHRDANLKRRGGAPPPLTRESPKSKLPGAKKKYQEDLENQDPNLAPATPGQAAKIAKETVKSSAERHEPPRPPHRPLRSTLSARNLFSGKDILTQISDFCNEIKKLAMPRGERPPGGGGGSGEEDKDTKEMAPNAAEEKGVEPLLALGEDLENTKEEKKKKKKQGRFTGKKDGMENLLRVPPDPKRCRENLPLLQEVRSCPPTPQRFPSPLSLRRKATVTPVKPCSKPDTSERGILREMVHNKEEVQALVGMDDCSNNAMSNSPATVEGKSVDLFWFFKPCTYL